MKAHLLLGCLAIASLTATAAGVETSGPEAKKLSAVDFNKNGFLEENELHWGVLNKTLSGGLRFDIPLNRNATPAEMTQGMSRDVARTFEDNLGVIQDILRSHNISLPCRISDLEPLALGTKLLLQAPAPDVSSTSAGTPAEGPGNTAVKKTIGRFYVRRSLDKVPQAGAEDGMAKSAKDVTKYIGDSAIFSYGNAREGGHEFTAIGVVAWAKSLDKPEYGGSVIYAFEFQRVNYVGAKAKVTEASPRFTEESNVANASVSWNGFFGPGFIPVSTSIRAGLSLNSDLNFESKVPKASLDFSFFGKSGFGSVRKFNSFAYQFDLALHGDYGYIAEKGPWLKTGKYGDRPSHAGPNVSFTLYPFTQTKWWAVMPISLNVSYLEYFKLSEESKDVRKTAVQLNWYLRKPGKGFSDPGLALTALYVNQRNVDNAKDDDSVIVGVGVGF